MSRTSSKAEGSFAQQHEAWRRAYAAAPSMRERFAKVEQLILDIRFADLKGIGSYSPQVRSLSKSAKAFFALACPRTLCLGGGFDLDFIIVAMLETERTTSAGTLQCHGWVDPSRGENARCLLQLHYRLQAVYEVPQPGAFQSEPAGSANSTHSRLKLR